MKKIKILTVLFTLLLTCGCSLVYINKLSIEETYMNILKQDLNLKSVSFEGYSYYLPQKTNLKSYSKQNSIIYYNNYKMYLYVDLVSYYYKVDNKYSVNNSSFYSKKIDINSKIGYLEVNETPDNKYYIDFMYNYSKIETIVNKKDLNKMLTQIAYILNSIKYKDNILDSIIGKLSIEYENIEFDIFETNKKDSNYLDIVEQYDPNRKNIKNEDTLEINNVE